MKLFKLVLSSTLLFYSMNSFADKIVPAGQVEEAIIGTGFDTDTQRFVGNCLNGDVEQHGQAKANISFSQTISESELEKELGFDAGGKFRYGAAKIGVSAKFLKSQRTNNYSIVAVYSGDYKFKNLLLKFREPTNTNLKPDEIEKERLSAVGIAARKDDLRWMETCGEEYVQQIERGAKLFYSIRIDFSSKEEKDLFETSFSYDSSYASVHAHLKNSKDSFSKNTQVTIGAMQIGGDVRRATELFYTKGGEGESADNANAAMAFVKCSFGDFSKCDQVMMDAWKYATMEFKEQLKTQGQDNADAGPAYINYITKKYSSAGIYNKYSSVLTKDVLKKRSEIEAAFDKELIQSAQISHLLNGKSVVLSKRQKEVMKATDVISKKNLQRLVAAAEVCYNSLSECAQAATEAQAQLQPIDEFLFNIEPEDYRQYCVLASSPIAVKSLRQSIKGMIDAAKEIEPDAFISSANQPVDECLVSDMVFSRNTHIDSFKNKGISTLAPLRQYTHFEYVNLSDNEISDLSPITTWSSIEELILHNNKIRELDALAALMSLEKLRISNNGIRTLAPLLALPNLVRVDARNNYPEMDCKILKVEVCLSATVKTDMNFIPIHTDAAVPLFMPSIAMYPDGNMLITGIGAAANEFFSNGNSFTPIYGFEKSSYGSKTLTLKDGTVLIAGGWDSGDQLYVYNPLLKTLTSKGKLHIPRAEHQMDLLNDGRVLITGGWENPVFWTGINPSFNAEIYDPSTGTVKLISRMNTARSWHTTTVLNNGNVLIAGGYAHSGSLATAEIFDVQSEKFYILEKTMGEGRGGHTATLLEDGKVLVVGGFSKYENAVANAELFNPLTKSFVAIPESMNRKRGHHAALRLSNGKVLITGGSENIYTPETPHQVSGATSISSSGEIYDPLENSFAEVPQQMFLPRARHAMVEMQEGMVLIVGGVEFKSTQHSEVFSYADVEVSWYPLF